MRKLLLIVVFFAVKALSFCQDEVVYYANKNDFLYQDYNSEKGYKITGKINKGEKLTIIDGKAFSVSIYDRYTQRIEVKTENNNIGWVYTDSISVADSDALPDDITGNVFTHSYYMDVLQSGKKETLFIYEPFWRNYFDKYKRRFNDESRDFTWYEVAYVNKFKFTNIYNEIEEIVWNHFDFLNEKIERRDGAYIFFSTCTYNYNNFAESDFGNFFSLNKKVKMGLKKDGDYLDVYINDIKTFSLIVLTEEIRDQFENLMMNNACDLSNMQMPRRVPKQLNAGEECHVLENLRLRNKPDTSAAVITVMGQGSNVTVLEVGQDATIDGTTAPWVRVETANGETGWCFGLYLRETRYDPPPALATDTNTIEKTENNDYKAITEFSIEKPAKKGAGFNVIMIAGTAVLLGGGAAVFVIKRRK